MSVPLDAEAAFAELAGQMADLARIEPAPVMIGIRTGGAWVAERLHETLGLKTPLSTLNIGFYRDDFTRIGLHPRVGPSRIETEIEGRCVILVDDVLYTGRTTRAAMNEIFDYGRPAAVRLAVLVDRGGRELPIAPDFVGATLSLSPERQIKLSGPRPLVLEEQ
jgi:pyrimidine operon attenuation protein/uracil phosphoribosyltransferase